MCRSKQYDSWSYYVVPLSLNIRSLKIPITIGFIDSVSFNSMSLPWHLPTTHFQIDLSVRQHILHEMEFTDVRRTQKKSPQHSRFHCIYLFVPCFVLTCDAHTSKISCFFMFRQMEKPNTIALLKRLTGQMSTCKMDIRSFYSFHSLSCRSWYNSVILV